MVTLKKYDVKGEPAGQVDVEEALLETTAHPQSVKDYIVALRANARQWSANTKRRPEVNHSGQKPHPQKGLGRARQGYLGAPQYKGGGRPHGPRPKFDQHVRINKKERRAAIRSLLAERIKAGSARLLSADAVKKPKTKPMALALRAMQLTKKRVLFLGAADQKNYESIWKSLRNLPKVECSNFAKMNGYDLALCDELVIAEGAWSECVAMLGGER